MKAKQLNVGNPECITSAISTNLAQYSVRISGRSNWAIIALRSFPGFIH